MKEQIVRVSELYEPIEVTYFGTNFSTGQMFIEDEFFIATDKDGSVWVYQNEPKLSGLFSEFEVLTGCESQIGTVTLPKGELWEDSLVRYEIGVLK